LWNTHSGEDRSDLRPEERGVRSLAKGFCRGMPMIGMFRFLSARVELYAPQPTPQGSWQPTCWQTASNIRSKPDGVGFPTRRTMSALLRVKTLSGRTRVRQGTTLVHVCQDSHVCQRKGGSRDWQAWRRRVRVCQWVPYPIAWHTCAVWHTWGRRNGCDGCWPPSGGRGPRRVPT